ncbi:MAG: 30S ribosomal protein S16 [Saprospirales bacterium]|nr:30S ribosomal protein S16 [Saprospirales bacterium]|tara:strand:- start:3532 stop:4233 length:702 start_codon:yes stop_codon:yes gene_type:complete
MPVKIRLTRQGRKKRPYYHIVIADARAPRDGKFIERIGMYNPMTKPATIEIDRAKAFEWLEKGAQPTNTARAILRFTGVMYMKHLQRGVTKGAHTQEQADAKLESWLAEKQTKIDAGKAETAQELIDFRKIVDGEVKAPVAPKRDEQAEAAFREESSPEAPAEKVEEAAAEVEKAAAEVEEAPAKVEEAPAEAEEAPAEAEEAPAEVEEAPAENVEEAAVVEAETPTETKDAE